MALSEHVQPREMSAEPSLAEQAYVQLRDRIIKLELSPGSVLSDEVLAAQLKLGRTPMREAIKRLAHEGLVIILPRRGTLVAEINVNHPMDVAEVRKELEGLAGRLAARRVTSEAHLEIDLLRAEVAALTGDETKETLAELDGRIHRTIHRLTRNPLLIDTLGRYYNLALRVWYSYGSRVAVRHVYEDVVGHDTLLEAIQQGDEELAESLLSTHVVATVNRLASEHHAL